MFYMLIASLPSGKTVLPLGFCRKVIPLTKTRVRHKEHKKGN